MNVVKRIFKALFILTLIISSMKVYGYNLEYKGNLLPGGTACNITNIVQASPDTIAEYHSAAKNAQGWVVENASSGSTSGGSGSFDSFYYSFAPSNKVFSTYNPGFTSNGSMNVWYDTNDANGTSSPIDMTSTGMSNFKGHKANIPKNEGTTTNGYIRIPKLDGTGRVKLLEWKVLNSGVVLTIYQINAAVITQLKDTFGSDGLTNGIRFSNGLRTQNTNTPNRSDLGTAWLFFQSTIGSWYSDQRGFTDNNGWMASSTGNWKMGASAANEYDNIIKISGTGVKAKREIYVNHIDEAGNRITVPGFSNDSVPMITPSGTYRSSVDVAGYDEHYTITEGETIGILKSFVTSHAGYTYGFTIGKFSIASTLATAAASVGYSSATFTDSPHPVSTSAAKVDDFIVINMIYHVTPPPVKVLPDLVIVGRLAFINTIDAPYMASTADDYLDYIPSTKQLTGYAKDAYPYVVRALRYESKNESSTSSATSTAYVTYTYTTWTYRHGSALQIGTPAVPSSAGPPPTAGSPAVMIHLDDSTCDWYKTTTDVTINRVFNYTVPYKHTWYQIVNFKMYRISLFEVYDTNTDIGGTLFNGGTYTMYPSATYESRYNNSRGRVPKTLTVTFPNKTYTLPAVAVDLAKPGGGYSNATGASQNSSVAALALGNSKLVAETNLSASNATLLTISYVYDNDYVELDAATDMLQRNNKSWSERITLATDASNVRDLDSTRQGTGQANGSTISYTSNLMNYMKPSTRLTTNWDFAPNYQTVPANRENGLRQLSAKIYYKISNDSKYNVGGTTFDSTDANYLLNRPLGLTILDFDDYNKVYAGADVNKVNVLTPINFGAFELITDKKVDHTTGVGNATILQKNAEFTITPTTAGSSTAGYTLGDTREFVKGYYFTFDFNIIYKGNSVLAYTSIYIPGANASITAKTTDSFSSGSADQISNSIKIVAITTNVTDALKAYFDGATFSTYGFMDYLNNKVRTSSTQNEINLLTRPDIINDSYHGIYRVINTRNVGRIFDFAITDCTDLAFKDVFRLPNATNVNQSSAVAYYGGYKYWNLYSSEYNEILERANMGTNPQKILPLGPYKNTNTKYVSAPKMGYRISFDLKTTGFMAANNTTNTRRVEVTPRYYYISKDGKTFDNNIKLYYKNSTSNYVNFHSSGYTIYFKPNDGYRYLRNSAYTDNFTSMSTTLESLLVSDKITLTNKMMATNNTSFIQSWYGEFKLPNSTIAISNVAGNVNNNINNPYKDGYIGVVFDINCIDTGGFTVSYDTSDKSSGSSTNTSQWDYEGFMNFKTPGSAVAPISPLRYQLERGMWEVDNARYQQVKGTVVLFDLDNRAANDFE